MNILVKKIVQEIEKEKVAAINKKEEEKAALKVLLNENELRKKVLAAQLEQERELDLQACREYARVLDKQEKDRNDYFKVRSLKSNEFMSKMIDTVLKDIDNKNKLEEEAIRKYEIEKDKK